MTRKSIPLAERFWNKVQKSLDCWLWQASTDKFGYGLIGVRRSRCVRAHIVSWQLHFGEIPPGLCVLHTCDVPACVRPDHLYLGDKQQNAKDRDERGRHVALQGSANGMAKLREVDVISIRETYPRGGITMRELAETYSVDETLISQIIRRVKWKHI